MIYVNNIQKLKLITIAFILSSETFTPIAIAFAIPGDDKFLPINKTHSKNSER